MLTCSDTRHFFYDLFFYESIQFNFDLFNSTHNLSQFDSQSETQDYFITILGKNMHFLLNFVFIFEINKHRY